MPDVTLVIDGQTVSVPAGTNIVDAARLSGVSIPVFCYHPKMKPVGMCRMCMVEVWTPRIDPATRQPVLDDQGKPVLALMMNKLQPGCVTPVSDGMEVRTVTDKVKFAQRGQLEFLLHSHPLDCPVCDKGGECPLQNLTMQWGPEISRFDYEDKIHFQKPIPLGDLIYLDRERCILCARCVRFEDEIAGDPVLGFDNRGRSWEIISKSDPPFDSKFSGNTTDICPVGALTSADFRFKARVWELQSTPSICTNCSVGCNTSLDMRHNELKRVMPRENDFVNEIWICDKGRFGMRYVEDAGRLKTPLIRRGEQLVPASWEEALSLVADKLTQIRDNAGAQALGGIGGPSLPNEDLFLFQRLFREVLGSNNLDYRDGVAGEPALDTWSSTLGVGKGTNLMALGKGTAVLIVGADPEEEASLYVLRVRGIMSRGGDVTVINPYPTKLGRSATRSIQPRMGTGPQVVLAMLKVIFEENLAKTDTFGARLRGLDELRRALDGYTIDQLVSEAGVSADTVRAAAQAFANAENGIIFYGRLALSVGPALVDALANLALLTGKAGRANNGLIGLLQGSNARGALALGVRPDAGTKPGLSAQGMWSAALDGQLRGMIIAGADPARENPAVAQALDALEFVVVQDLFLTETASRADVVLPLAAVAERDGTFTNAERRVQRFRQARQSYDDVRAGWQVFQQLATMVSEPALVGAGAAGGTRTAQRSTGSWDYLVAEDVTAAISRTVSAFAGATPAHLSATGGMWGRQQNEQFYYDGTSYENTEGIGVQLPALADDGKSALALAFQAPQAPASSTEQPITLVIAPRAYDNGDWGRGSKLQPRMVPAHIILSLADARALGLTLGERVAVRSSVGTVELPVQVDTSLAQGLALLPNVRGAGLPNVITGAATLVAVEKL